MRFYQNPSLTMTTISQGESVIWESSNGCCGAGYIIAGHHMAMGRMAGAVVDLKLLALYTSVLDDHQLIVGFSGEHRNMQKYRNRFLQDRQ